MYHGYAIPVSAEPHSTGYVTVHSTCLTPPPGAEGWGRKDMIVVEEADVGQSGRRQRVF